jgi:hypothetical protein
VLADDGEGEGHIAIGKLRGEDYNFEFHGKVGGKGGAGSRHVKSNGRAAGGAGSTAVSPEHGSCGCVEQRQHGDGTAAAQWQRSTSGFIGCR